MVRDEAMTPALVWREAGRVHTKELTPTDMGFAVDHDQLFRDIGAVDMVRRGDNREWYATTVVDTRIGPFSSADRAIQGLLAYYGQRPADPSETMEPLF